MAGRRGTEAFPLQVPSLPISPLLLLFSLQSSFSMWLPSSLLPIWPFHRQVHANTHTVHKCIVLSVSHTNPHVLALPWGVVLRYVSVLNYLPWSQGVDHSSIACERKTAFLPLLVALNACLHSAYIDRIKSCACVCVPVCRWVNEHAHMCLGS